MIEEPYRWVEAIENRREYIEDQLRGGSPIVLLNCTDGLSLTTCSHETRKIFEIYDKIAFSALGHPADIETMRMMAIDMAHIEGFNRAVHDVSLRRLVHFGMSPVLKSAFEQVYAAPYIIRMMLTEIGEHPDQDSIIKLNYDGSFVRSPIQGKHPFTVLAGTGQAEEQMLQYLIKHNGNARRTLVEALKLAAKTWAIGMETASRQQDTNTDKTEPEEIDPIKVLKEQLKSRHIEASVLERNQTMANKFRIVDEKEIRAALKDL